ncbi:MAG: phage major capsid protein [Pseudomonadota bacterium]|nr:phage major capsid protein [Pseudomonadota bacterium]
METINNSGNRARGLVTLPHANAGNAAAIFADMRNTIDTHTRRQDERLSNVEAAVDGLSAGLAAIRVGPGASTPAEAAGRRGFVEFLRSGAPHASMRESSGPDGGFAVPETIDGTIQSQLLEFSPLRSWATVITLGQGQGTYSFLVNRRGTSSGWVGEEQARPETDTPQFAMVTPFGGEIYANASISQWLLDDSNFDLEQFIRDNIIDEFAVQEGAAFVAGDGINKPSGFLNGETPVSTGDSEREFGVLQYVPSGVAADINDGTHNGVDVLTDLVYSLKPAYKAGPGVGWMMNSTVAGKIRKLKSLGDTANYLWQESVQAGAPPMLLGYPVAIDENMPNIGAGAFPIAFGNWRRGYRIVDRLGTRVLRDPYTNKPNVMFYLTKRVHGSIADSNAIKLLKCAAS